MSPTVACAVYVSTKSQSVNNQENFGHKNVTWRHMAKNLSAIDTNPVERGVREDIATSNNVSTLTLKQVEASNMLFLYTRVSSE